MPTATRAAALKTVPRRYATCYVPEQDLVYRLRSITERERQEYRQRWCGDDEQHNRLELIAFVVVDEQGELLFTRDDVAALEALDSAITTRLYQACIDHVTFETVEDLTKNSARIPTGGSP
jgi:hypothetical protein